jgi:hypothetical protein
MVIAKTVIIGILGDILMGDGFVMFANTVVKLKKFNGFAKTTEGRQFIFYCL